MPAIAKEILMNLPWGMWGQALLMLLMAQVQLFGMASPLAAAWLSTAVDGGHALPRWMGLAAGALLCGGAGWWALPALSGAVIAAWTLHRDRGKDRLPAETVILLAGCLCIADAAARSGGNIAFAPQWFVCGLAAAALATPFAALRRERAGQGWLRRRMPLTVGLAEAGTLQFPGKKRMPPAEAPAKKKPPLEFPARQQAQAAWVGLAAAALGASAGAALVFGEQAGAMVAAVLMVHWPEMHGELLALMLSAALGMAGVPLEAASAVGAMWLAMRFLERWGRPVKIAGGLSAAGLWLLAGGRADALGYLAALVPAAASAWLLPRTGSPAEVAYDDLSRHQRLRKRTQDQLNALADALSDMAQGPASGLDPPREEELLLSLRTRLCNGCVRYERCWNGRAGEGLRLLCELITRSVNGTLPEGVLPDMMRRCMRAGIIPNRLYAELDRFSRMRSAQIVRLDGAQRARLTIDTAAQSLRSMAAEQGAGAQPTGWRAVEAALRFGGLSGASLTLSPEGLVLSRRDGWTREETDRACHICCKTLGAHYKPAFCDGRTLCLREDPALVARIGWDGLSAEGSRSGDSVHIGALDDRRQLVVISDGMGVGEAAAEESRRAVRAVAKLLRAGIPPERAALLANQMMMSQGTGEMFVTLDLCVIDNWKMEAIWVKMAACDSYLLREHDCSVVSGGRLPMGILAEAAPQVTKLALKPGDVIVMGSDGAMEGLDPDTLQRCLIRNRGTEASALARAMRQAGDSRRVHADDQTLAVICVQRAG